MGLGLAGKVALITGGSAGVSLGVARAFARESGEVVVAARDRDRAEEAAAGMTAESGPIARDHACDAATAHGCASLVVTVRDAGGREILVSNAGAGSERSRSSPTSSSFSARDAPPTPSASSAWSMAACSAPSEEGFRCPFRSG
jgi:NAD(P)-dependent dehydrogenase (short-subunit alcohol dehydrogenase family)